MTIVDLVHPRTRSHVSQPQTNGLKESGNTQVAMTAPKREAQHNTTTKGAEDPHISQRQDPPPKRAGVSQQVRRPPRSHAQWPPRLALPPPPSRKVAENAETARPLAIVGRSREA